MASPDAFYTIQPAFTGGEISSDVASRVDLDKYQVALLQAENAIIRPYGAVRKRPGMIYVDKTMYKDKKSILVRFNYTTTISYMLEFGDKHVYIRYNGEFIIGYQTPYSADMLSELRFVQNTDVMYVASGQHPVYKLERIRANEWKFSQVKWQRPPFDELDDLSLEYGSLQITEDSTSEIVYLRGNKNMPYTGGRWIKMKQTISGSSVQCRGGTSSSIVVGDAWKIITHGTWTGTVTIYVSYDNGTTWVQLRQYTSANDYNPTESGTVEEYALMKVTVSVSSGSCTADLSAYPYTHVSYGEVTRCTTDKTLNVDILEVKLDEPMPTANRNAEVYSWYLSEWYNDSDKTKATWGYPACITFFQDRLCLGGSLYYPQRIWMSKSGDYENFDVEKESGTVTDDSAISANLLSLNPYQIKHLNSGSDLVVLTDGNEWTISGNEIVTPSNITPRLQQNYGCNDVEPVRVGNRLVYVQRRGSIIRDMAYAYDTDSYGGYDLTLLAKHLIKGVEIVDSTFAQEPDSIIYFVTSDGELLCLTYIMEQKVYAWSHIVTDGKVESVMAAQEGNNDVVYAVVAREINGETVRYIEKFDLDPASDNQQDYVMMDSAVRKTFDTATKDITGLEHLEGREVLVMGDGYLFDPMTVENGSVSLPEAVTNVVVGLPYTMILEQPDFNTTVSGIGNIQGMQQTVNTVILRLSNSFGGEIGPDKNTLHDIMYDVGAMDLGEPCLYSGDKGITMGSGGFNKHGRVYIRHDKPYPFTLLSIVRGVTLGGTGL